MAQPTTMVQRSTGQRVLRWFFGAAVAGFLAGGLTGCGYNDIQRTDEATNSAWAEVLSQYQRRADLIPNLVNTVKGYAAQEKEVLTQVTEARSRVGQAELAGTENRITVARKRYIDSINTYNVLVREFPVNLTAKVMGYAPKPQFSVENEAAISKPPTVDFGGGQTAPAK